jgi:hypothetical protein
VSKWLISLRRPLRRKQIAVDLVAVATEYVD